MVMASNILQSSSASLGPSNAPYYNDVASMRPTENKPPQDRPIDGKPKNGQSKDVKSSIASRRRSTARESKAPTGPRPPEFGSRRITTGTSQAASQTRSFLPSTTSEPFLGLSTRRVQASANSAGDGSTSDSSANGPQSSLASVTTRAQPVAAEPRLEDFPKPSSSNSFVRGTAESSRRSASIGRQISLSRNSSDGLRNLRARPSASPVRSGGAALQAAQRSSASVTVALPPPSAAPSSRRQSQIPPSSPAKSSAKQPRKSIGPGYTIPSARERTVFDPASRTFVPDLGSARDADLFRKTSSDAARSRQPNSTASPIAPASLDRNVARGRDVKSLLMNQPHVKPPTSGATNGAFASAVMPKQADGAGAARINNSAIIPSSSRRQSNAATYVGGLGARTVSPTDVRRSRRLSTAAPQQPPMPARSPTPDLLLTERPPPTPPVLPLQKPGTPNSSRATPDALHPLHSTRSAASSRSSYTSVRPLSSSSQHRSSSSISHGKSAQAKSRGVHNSAGGEDELVPPVPAIPKAFESPTELTDKLFFPRESSGTSSGAGQTVADDRDDEPFMTPEEQKPDPLASIQDTKFGRRLTYAGRPDTQREGVSTANARQQSDSAQLPPLNLLPLSTPTATRIASFTHDGKTSLSGKLATTPPPHRSSLKTPTTPMTASKALFSTYDIQKSLDLTAALPPFRSSTATASHRTNASGLDGSFTESPGILTSASPATPRHGPSPFGSFSLPRLNGELQYLPTRQVKEESQDGTQPTKRASNFLHRRPSTKATKEISTSTALSGNDAESTQLASSSLRRKLSLSWRRSSSKASHSSQHADDDIALSHEMPPPKLPASAALSAQSKSSKLSSKSVPGKPTDTSSSLKGIQSRNSSASELPRPSTKTGPPERNIPSTRSSGSLFSMPRMLAARNSQNNLKNTRTEAIVDKNDLAADEEMRKLASRRKEFESAARELDDLRKKAHPKDKVTPSQASSMASLNIFERGEIVDYRDVFFCGTKNASKVVGDLAAENTNFGFDDERGDYKIVCGDHLAYRYEVVDVLGKGSFGQVVRCIDHKKGELVAVKIIRNKKRFHQQALVEVNILQRLRDWDPTHAHSMVCFTQSFYFRGHLCISTELLGMNLYEFIRAHEFTGFSVKLVRRFTKQLLGSLSLLQGRSVIHCDLKPENILLAHPLQSEIKVIDFGSSCFENEKVYTYIQSRFYRSPEVILGMSYGLAIDMWSLGCILAELFTGYPIFPGENEQEQLACIMEVFGPPEKHLIERSTRKKLFFDSLGKPRITVSSKGKRRRPSSKTLAQALKCDDEGFLDFITQCLRWDPERRMKPDEALQHEFVTGIKKTSRFRGQQSTTASPAKRSTLLQTPLKSKAGSEAMAPGVKGATKAIAREDVGNSPLKENIGARRKSSMYEQANSSKSSIGGTSNISSLPRMSLGHRSTTGKPDLASAAAIASLAGGSKGRGTGNV